jgi:hypothetical protein
LSTLYIEQQGNNQPRLVVNSSSTGFLSHNSVVCNVMPCFAQNSTRTVLLKGAPDISTWKNEKNDGITRMWRFTFQCEKNAKEFIDIYAKVAAKMKKKVSHEPPVVEFESLIFEGIKGEDRVDGECNSCWNKGTLGEKCDNCGEIMVVAVQHSYSDESSNNEEEESDLPDTVQHSISDESSNNQEEDFDLPNTQDWPDMPLMPFGKKEF